MLRKLVAGGLLSVMLAAALFSLFRLPVEAETVYREITGMEELTDGRYVLITPQDIAPGTLAEEEGVISAVALTAVGGHGYRRRGMGLDRHGKRGHSEGRARRVRRTHGGRRKRHYRRGI